MDTIETLTNGDILIEEADLEYEEGQHKDSLLSNLNKLRKENQLCDAILVIGRHETPIHRAVVAASSGYLLEMFKKDKKEGKIQNMYKLKDIDFESFQYLLDYIYTGRLAVPGPHVKEVYKASIKLKILDAARTCSEFLAANLSIPNCLGVRKFAIDNDLREKADKFIQNNVISVASSKLFFGLPTVQVEIIGADDDLIEPSNNRHMIELVLSWAKDNLNPEKPRLDDLTEQVNILYLNPDNTLTDFKDINDERTKEEEIVIDYKCKKRQSIPPQLKDPAPIKGPLMANVRKFHINPEDPVSPMEWSIIADYQTKERTFMSICIMNNDLAVLSIHCRGKTVSPSDSGSEAPDSPTNSSISLDRAVSLTPLATMSVPRCGFGLKVVGDKIFACGGYDRGECLKSTELYDPKTNKWSPAADMYCPRGRFSTESVNGVIYAVGGSNGHIEQKPVECYDNEKNKWYTVSQVEKAKVSQALVCAEGKLYCIGGCVGQNSVSDCEVFDPETKSWSKIASLVTGRYQIAACYYNGLIYAIGGTDGWNCTSVTEIYDIQTDKWIAGPSLNVARRGAGCDVINGKIYVVGGSDGSHSLKSSEVLENSTNFILGPQMSIGRANVGVVSFSNRLYAVGGFSGKKFLDTFEYLDSKYEEWCSYMPVDEVNGSKTPSNRNFSADHGCQYFPC